MGSVQFSCSVVLTLCNPMNCSTPGLLVHHQHPSPPKPMSIESVMPPNHLILCCPLLLLPSMFPSIRVFSNESALRIRWPKYWSFTLSIFGILQRIFRTDFYQDGLGGSLCSPRDFQVQFSRSVVSDSWPTHGLQHVRPPCPSPTPRVHPNPCPSSR